MIRVTAVVLCQGICWICERSGTISYVLSHACSLSWGPRCTCRPKAQGRRLPRLPCRLHADQDVNGKPESLYVDQEKLKHSVHGAMFSCVDCHTDVKSLAHDQPPKKITCAQCHADAQQAYAHSLHAQAGMPGNGSPAATCEDCHGGAHAMLAGDDPKSPVNHANIPATCGRCHGQKFLMESNGQSAQPFFSYQASVHGPRRRERIAEGRSVHRLPRQRTTILPANQAQSPIYKFNVPATCGKCHVGCCQHLQRRAFTARRSRAATALAPVCTDCHGIHTIKSPGNPNSPVAEQNLSRDTCAPLPRGRAPLAGVRRARQPRHQLLRQLSRAGSRGRFGGGGELLKLPRRARHPALERSPFDASTAPTSTRPAASATRASPQKFTLTKVHLEDGAPTPGTSTRLRCAGCDGSTSS